MNYTEPQFFDVAGKKWLLVMMVQEWTGPGKAEFNAMGERAKALGTPGSLVRIVRDLAELAKHPTEIADRRRAEKAASAANLSSP